MYYPVLGSLLEPSVKNLGILIWGGLTRICFIGLLCRLTEIFSNFFPESISCYINCKGYRGYGGGLL